METAQQVQPEQLAAGEQRDEQDDQQGARVAHAGGRPEMYPQNGDSCLGTAVSARELECPISALQTLLWYEQHDPSLHRETDKHWTVNGPTMYDVDYISKCRPEVAAAYEAAAAEPGPHLEAAVGEFVSSVAAGTPGGRVAEHSMTSLLVEGVKRCGAEAVTEDARGLVMNAVFRSGDLEVLVAELKWIIEEGVFDREISEAEIKVAEMPGFRDFDPSTAAGRECWRQLRELFEAYFSHSALSAEPDVCEQRQKEKWKKIKLLSVSLFIPSEKKAFRKWKQTGGDVTDATRIEDVKARFGPKLALAYARYVESEACVGRRDDQLEKKWGLFCKAMERCGKAVGPEDEDEYDAAMIAAGRVMVAAAAGGSGGSSGGKEECWERLAYGECSFGEARCRFSHNGIAGSKRKEVVDEQGNCRQFVKHKDCRRLQRG